MLLLLCYCLLLLAPTTEHLHAWPGLHTRARAAA